MPVNFFRTTLACAALTIVLVGCQSSAPQPKTPPAPTFGLEPLRPTNRIYIAIPDDAVYKKETVPNSGQRTALALMEAFQRKTKYVSKGRGFEPTEKMLEHAREALADYVVVPTILKWEDHPTEWNAIRDHLVVKLDLIEPTGGISIRSETIDVRSKILSDGEDAPQDLLAAPVEKFVRSLYRVTYTPSALQKR